MFTLCILFTTLATNTYGMFEGASKQILNLKILPRRDRPPPRFEIPRSATGFHSLTILQFVYHVYCCNLSSGIAGFRFSIDILSSLIAQLLETNDNSASTF